MADSIRVADQGVPIIRNVLPVSFNWPLFCVALALMAAPIVQVVCRLRRQAAEVRKPLDYERWLAHFERNRLNRPEPDWSAPIPVLPNDMVSLLSSLAQFQLGDGGGPASLIARDADRFRNSTPEMRKLVDHWFAEEREHSRLLGCAVDNLGGQRIKSHWSFTAFCNCRRIFGVRFELQVLLLTEITSTAYYRLLKRHCRIPWLEAMCHLILRDEAGHISFHCDRLAANGRSLRGLAGWLWAAQLRLCGYAAATMLWANHRPCIAGLGGTTREFYGEVSRELHRFLCALAIRTNARTKSAGIQSNNRRRGRDEAMISCVS